MKKFSAIVASSVFALMPMLAFAQFGAINDFIDDISSFINNVLIPLIFGAALLMFIYGMFKYFILGGSDDGSREKGKQLMLWAIVGFVAMVSVFGVVNLIADGLGFSQDENIQNIPNVPTNNN